MNIQRKISSLFRRKIPFFALTYGWDTQQLQLVTSKQQYLSRLHELKKEGMCKRATWKGQKKIRICDEDYDIVMVSFGDIRANKFIYGESPLAACFGVCLFDYVFAFVVNSSESGLAVRDEF